MMNPAEQARRLASHRKRIAYEDANERQHCTVPGCYKPRQGFGKLCRNHHADKTHFDQESGSNGQPVKPPILPLPTEVQLTFH